MAARWDTSRISEAPPTTGRAYMEIEASIDALAERLRNMANAKGYRKMTAIESEDMRRAVQSLSLAVSAAEGFE